MLEAKKIIKIIIIIIIMEKKKKNSRIRNSIHARICNETRLTELYLD